MRSRFLVLSILFGFIVPTFGLAQTATDVVCSGCVNTTDIQNSTIANTDISATARIAPTKILGTAWTALTDGSASGLDADVFDGIESADFLRSDQSGSVAGTVDVAQLRVDTANMNTSKIILYGSEGSGYGIGTESGGGIVYGVDVPDANHFHDFRFGGTSAFKIFGDGSATLATEATSTSGNAELRIQAQNTGNDRSAILRFMPSGTGGSVASGGNKAILRLDATSTAATPWGFDFQNTAGSSVFGITNDGKVGVGTDHPADALSVYMPYIANADTRISLANDYVNMGIVGRSNEYGQFRLGFIDNGSSEAMSLYFGNVGIGTSSPKTRLDVRGDSATSASTIQIVGDSTSTLLLGQDADGGVIRGQGGNNALKFLVGGTADQAANGSGSEAMRITSNGYVGIGTSSPDKPLTINAGTNDPIYMQSDSNHNWYFGPNVAGQRMGLYDVSTGELKMSVDSSGDMCLGDCN